MEQHAGRQDAADRIGTDDATRDDGGLAALQAIAADYEVFEQIGRGSSGVVWRARDRALDRDVAIKVVRAAHGDDEMLDRSAQEARLVARLPHHPNIVAIHAVRRLGPRAIALVMQFVPGGTLRDRLVRDGALSPDEATATLRDLARALHFAHSAGIVHRDVKPENVYLDAVTGRALLSDFGAATLLHADSRRTAIGAVIGTPAYMSPEQLAGGVVDGRSDIYSVGLVGWEMLTGRFPWGSSNLYEILYRQRHTDLAPVDELRAGLPAPVVSAVEGALERDPARRWPSAATFLAALLAPDDAPRHERQILGEIAPATLTTAEAPEQHARTLRIDSGDAELAGIAPSARRSSDAHAASVPSVPRDATPRDAAPGDATPDDATIGGSEPPATGDVDDHGGAPDDADDDWRPDARDPAWRAALAAMPAAPRRRYRRIVAALAALAAVALIVAALALRGDARGLGEAGSREMAGDVEADAAAERALARDLAATAVPLADSGDRAIGDVPPPAPTTDAAATGDVVTGDVVTGDVVTGDVVTGDAVAARCASAAAADQRACLLARLAERDAALNATYADLVRALRVRDGGRADGPDTPSVRRLRERQRAWIMGRDRACRSAGVARAGALWAERRASCLGDAGDRWAATLRRELAAARDG